MKWVILNDGREFGTNNDGSGLFYKQSSGCDIQQWRGNRQTPNFKTPRNIRDYIRKEYGVVGVRIVKKIGW